MRATLPAISAMTALMLLQACGQQPLEVAPEGAAPAIETAVGPVPGGGHAPQVRANPYAGNAVAANEGNMLFNSYNCSGCHGIHGGGGMGPSLRDPMWIYGGSPNQIYASISQGRTKGMPSWASKIPETQIWKIVTYIGTLNTPGEIDPPRVPLSAPQEHQAEFNPAAAPPPRQTTPGSGQP